MKFVGQGFQKLEPEQDTQTQKYTHTDAIKRTTTPRLCGNTNNDINANNNNSVNKDYYNNTRIYTTWIQIRINIHIF